MKIKTQSTWSGSLKKEEAPREESEVTCVEACGKHWGVLPEDN